MAVYYVASSLLITLLIIITNTTQGQGQQQIPDWLREATTEWLHGPMPDYEYWGLLAGLLEEEHLQDAVNDIRAGYEQTYRFSPVTNPPYKWIEDRAEWWINGRVTDTQYLEFIYHFNMTGHLSDASSQSHLGDTDSMELEGFLLTEREIDKIMGVTKWRFVTTEYGFDEADDAVDSVRVLMRDITRVYEPVLDRFKVPIMTMQITQLADKAKLDNYWKAHTNRTAQEIFESAHMTGTTSDDTRCFFEYNGEGAVTACTHNSLIIQVTIFDTYNEHYVYRTPPHTTLDKTEPTTSIVDGVLKKIGFIMGKDHTGKLHHILKNTSTIEIPEAITEPNQNITYGTLDPLNTTDSTSSAHDGAANTGESVNRPTMYTGSSINGSIDGVIDSATDDIQTASLNIQPPEPHMTNPEESTIHGVTDMSCVRDDFGIVMIAGIYQNDNSTRNSVSITVSFVDWFGGTIGNTTVTITDIGKFDERRFLGHVRWDENFKTCWAAIN